MIRHVMRKAPRTRWRKLWNVVKQEKERQDKLLAEDEKPEYNVMQRLINPVHLNDRALLYLLVAGTAVILPWKFFMKPALQAIRDIDREKYSEVPSTPPEEPPEETSEFPSHVFKLKDKPEL